MNVWKQVYADRILKEERLLYILANEYDRIGKSDKLKPMRKYKVKEIKEQCQKIRELRRDYEMREEKEMRREWKNVNNNRVNVNNNSK